MPKRILVVESDEANAKVLCEALFAVGLEPVRVQNGLGACEAVANDRFAAALVAVGLPDMPCKALVSELRRTPGGALLPVLLTGHRDSDPSVKTPTEALSIGADYYFHLPDDLHIVGQRVRGWIGDVPDVDPGAEPPQAADAPPLHAFVADDVTEANVPTLSALREAHEAKRRAQREGSRSRRRPRPASTASTTGSEQALNLVKDGEGLRAKGRVDAAVDAYLTAADLYERGEKLDPALALYKLVLHLDPTRADVAQHAGRIAVDAGRLADGGAIYRRSADALEEAGRIDDAVNMVGRLVTLNPSDPALVLRLAELEARQVEFHDAPADDIDMLEPVEMGEPEIEPKSEVEPALPPTQDAADVIDALDSEAWDDLMGAALADSHARLTPPPTVAQAPERISATPIPASQAKLPPIEPPDLPKAEQNDGRAEVEAALEGLESLLNERTDVLTPEWIGEAAVRRSAAETDFGRAAEPPPDIAVAADPTRTRPQSTQQVAAWLPPAVSDEEAATALAPEPEEPHTEPMPEAVPKASAARAATEPQPVAHEEPEPIAAAPEPVAHEEPEPIAQSHEPEPIAAQPLKDHEPEPVLAPEPEPVPGAVEAAATGAEAAADPEPQPKAIEHEAEAAPEAKPRPKAIQHEAEAAPEAKPRPKAIEHEAEAATEAKPRPKATEHEAEAAPEAEPQPKAIQHEAEAAPEAKPQPKAIEHEAEAAPEAEPRPKAIPQAPEAKPQPKAIQQAPGAKPQPKAIQQAPEAKPQPKAIEHEAEAATEAEPRPKAIPQAPEAKPQPKAIQHEAEAATEAKPRPKATEHEAEAASEAKPQPKAIPQAPEAKPQPKAIQHEAEAATEAKPQPKAIEHEAEAATEAKPQPKAIPQAPEAKPQPKAIGQAPEAKPQPKAIEQAPQPQPQPQPKAIKQAPEAKPQPKAIEQAPEPQPQPKPSSEAPPRPVPERAPGPRIPLFASLLPASLLDDDSQLDPPDAEALPSSDLDFEDSLPEIDIEVAEEVTEHTPPPASTLSVEPADVLSERDDGALVSEDLPVVVLDPAEQPRLPSERRPSLAQLAELDATEVNQPAFRGGEEPPFWGEVSASNSYGPVAFEAPTLASALTAKPLTPSQGRLASVTDSLALLAHAKEQGATGVLHLQESVNLVLVDGLPAARRGKTAVQAFIRLLRETGKNLAHAGLELLLHVDSDRPVVVARELAARGKMDPIECTIYLNRHLEDGVGGLLDHRGGWWFEVGDDMALSVEELVPDPLGPDQMLADLIASRSPWNLIEGGLASQRCFEAVGSEQPSNLSPRDARLWRLLCTEHPLGDAGQLAGLSPERSAAFAAVQVALQRLKARPTPPPRPPERRPWIPLLGAQTPGERYSPAAVPPATRRVRAMGTQMPHGALGELDPPGRIRALAELVRTSDYFTILGVDTQASKADIDKAHNQLRSMIQVPSSSVDPSLERLAKEIVRSLDEARDVLKVPELKAAYLSHLRG